MILFVSFLLLTLLIISNGLQLSHEKSNSTFYDRIRSNDNEFTDQVCGRDTNPGKVPFYASIEYDDPTVHYTMCSGVLIADRWVLTDGYCISFIFGPIRVVLGDKWNNKTIGVKDIYFHPDCSFRTGENSMALLLLKEPVQFSRNIQPICLPEPGEDATLHGRYGKVAGYEKLTIIDEEKPTFTKMHITTLPIDRSDDCDKFFKKVMHKNITDSFFCAGYPKRRKEGCFPDRGDPFMVKVRKHWVIAGLTLVNDYCKRPHALDIYIRVGFYLDWIKRTIEKYNS
ncbi:vitamin K-dependent protein C-like isoform X1 [Tetranychus urticae]|uniref:Peptidase S1 domain-containing protein n=1 Tax=Tetranychus urticae TaxID=32264 RepID=T1L3H6_TETUR|nr:vitamin K-dependent protein C-like isoform X1 [Tetranychus urticae]